MVAFSTRFSRYAPTLVPGRVLCILSKRYKFAREGGSITTNLLVRHINRNILLHNKPAKLNRFSRVICITQGYIFPVMTKILLWGGRELHRLKNLMFWLPKVKVVKYLKEISKRSRLESRIPTISSFEEALKRVVGFRVVVYKAVLSLGDVMMTLYNNSLPWECSKTWTTLARQLDGRNYPVASGNTNNLL